MASLVVLPAILVCGLRSRKLLKDQKTKTFHNKGSYSGSNTTSTCITLSSLLKTLVGPSQLSCGVGILFTVTILQMRKPRLQSQGCEQLQVTRLSFEGVRIWTQVYWVQMRNPCENCGASYDLERGLGLTHLAALGQRPGSLSDIDSNSVIHPWNVS